MFKPMYFLLLAGSNNQGHGNGNGNFGSNLGNDTGGSGIDNGRGWDNVDWRKNKDRLIGAGSRTNRPGRPDPVEETTTHKDETTPAIEYTAP